MKSSNVSMSVKDAAIKYGPYLCGYAKDDRVTRVMEHGNRTRIFIRPNIEWWGRPAYKVIVEGKLAEIKEAFESFLLGWTNLGIRATDAFYAWQRRIRWDDAIVEVTPGTVCTVLLVRGTYFGSGSYVASWRSNAKHTVDDRERDTGFAVEEPTDVTLQPGEYLIQYESSSPGSDIRRIYLCK